MIDFDDEVMRFQLCPEVGEVEAHIVDSDMTDISDIISNIIRSTKTAAPVPGTQSYYDMNMNISEGL